MFTKIRLKAGLLSLLIFLIFIGTWSLATYHKEDPAVSAVDAEYAAMMGTGAGKSGGFPPPSEVGTAFVTYLSDPFYDKGPNDKVIGGADATGIQPTLSTIEQSRAILRVVVDAMASAMNAGQSVQGGLSPCAAPIDR